MDEKAEAQTLLAECLRKINSTKQALGNSEVEAHKHINGMLAFVHAYVGEGFDRTAQVRSCLRRSWPSSIL
jgi:ribosomal protein L30/L7E